MLTGSRLVFSGLEMLTCWCCSTLFAGKQGLENAKSLLVKYKDGQIHEMTPELWKAKKVVDSTLHPGTRYTICWKLEGGAD